MQLCLVHQFLLLHFASLLMLAQLRGGCHAMRSIWFFPFLRRRGGSRDGVVVDCRMLLLVDIEMSVKAWSLVAIRCCIGNYYNIIAARETHVVSVGVCESGREFLDAIEGGEIQRTPDEYANALECVRAYRSCGINSQWIFSSNKIHCCCRDMIHNKSQDESKWYTYSIWLLFRPSLRIDSHMQIHILFMIVQRDCTVPSTVSALGGF